MPNNYLSTSYQEFIHLSRYSRWLPEKERRETWDETVARYFNFFTKHLKTQHKFKLTNTQNFVFKNHSINPLIFLVTNRWVYGIYMCTQNEY